MSVDRWAWAEGRERLPWWQQALMLPGDTLGSLGTVKDIAADATLRPALGLATAGTTTLENILDQMRGMQGRQPLPGDWSPSGLAAYQRARFEQAGPVPQFLGETVVDPLTYVGGPLRMAATGAARALPAASRPLQAVARADEAYERLTAEIPGRAMGTLGDLIKRTEIGQQALRGSKTAILSRQVDDLFNAFRELRTQDDGYYENFLKIVTGAGRRAMDTTGMPKAQAQGWQTLEERIAAIDNPAHKFVASNIYENVRKEKEALSASIDPMVRALRANPAATRDEYDAIYQMRHNRIMDLQESLDESLTLLEKRDWSPVESLFQANPQVRDRLSQNIDDALTKIKERYDYQRLVMGAANPNAQAQALQQIKQVDRSRINQIFQQNINDPDALAEALSQYRNTFRRRTAYSSANDLFGISQGWKNDPLMQSIAGFTDEATEAGMAMMTKAYGDLRDAGLQVLPEYMTRVSDQAANTLRNSEQHISQALTAVAAARRNIMRTAAPFLDQMTPEEQALATGSMDDLVRLMSAYGADPIVLGKIKKDAARFTTDDILDESKTYDLIQHHIVGRYADALGIKRVPSWYSTAVSSWKELSLLSLSYNVANLATGLFLSAKSGVRPGAVMQSLFRNLRAAGPNFKDALLHGQLSIQPVSGDVAPLMRAYGRVDQNGDILRSGAWARMAGHGGEIAVNQDARRTALGRVNPLLRAGIGGGLFGGASLMAEGDDPGQAGLLAGVGAAAGLASPRFAAVNRALSQVIESALRDTAAYTAIAERHGSITQGMGEFISGIATKGNKADLGQWFAAINGETSPELLRRAAITRGFSEQEANQLAGQWSGLIRSSEQAGEALSTKINFDYEDVPNITEWLRSSGVMPFVTWQTKALPIFAGILLSNPRYFVLVDEYRRATEADRQARGLTGRVQDRMEVPLTDPISDALFGRPGSAFLNPLAALIPIMDALPGDRESYAQTGQDRLLEVARQFGLGISPLVQYPLSAAGVLEEQPGNIVRTTAYAEAATGVNPEAPLKEAQRRVRRAVGAETSRPITDSPSRDAAIRNRIDEMFAEEGYTGPTSGAYLAAKDNPDSEIWQLAKEDVDRERTSRTLIGAALPVRPSFVSRTEQDIRAAKVRAGTTGDQIQALLQTPPTGEELNAADRALRQAGEREITPEMRAEQAVKMRLSARFQAGEKSQPLSPLLTNNASTQDDREARAWAKYNEFSKRVKRMRGNAKSAATKRFMQQNPDVAAVLAEARATAF